MSESKCELCSSTSEVSSHEVPQTTATSFNNTAQLCNTCQKQILNLEKSGKEGIKYWYILRESIWSENPAVKVLAWRILNKLLTQDWAESWTQDLLDQLYMEDDLLGWAKTENAQESKEEPSLIVRDSNGAVLVAGDSVTLIKDLDVKGANFTAKRGTLVKNISLTENPTLIEGRVNGTQIVLKTCFLKKAN